jgi:hypothetical protein
VVLFPDLMATKDWQDKARRIGEMIPCKIHVSTDLEAMATDAEKAAGLDLMDYYLLQQETTQQKPARDPSPPPVPDGITRARNDGGVSGTTSTSAPDGPIIGPHGYPASWDEIPAKFQAVVTIGTNTPRAPQTVENETIEGVNECFTFDWFVSEAQKCFTRSMIKAPGDYYPAFITSYRATLRRAGINERELMEALIL